VLLVIGEISASSGREYQDFGEERRAGQFQSFLNYIQEHTVLAYWLVDEMQDR
jgi:hypothetical protein